MVQFFGWLDFFERDLFEDLSLLLGVRDVLVVWFHF